MPRRIVGLVADLMDRSRITGALDATEWSVAFTADAGTCAGVDAVVIDLARYGSSVAAVRAAAPAARIVAFGPHVDGGLLDRARTDGADVVLARSRFFQDPAAAVTTG